MPADKPGNPGIRATDANRADVSSALDKALDEGQIDRFEHLERVRTATRARHVSELRPLLADLQGVSVDLPGDPSPKRRKSAAEPTHHDDSSPTARRAVIFGLLTVVAVGALGLSTLFNSDDPEPASPPSAIEQVDDSSGSDGSDDSDSDAVVLDNPSPLTLEGLEAMFSSASEASGTEFATRMTAHPEHGGMEWVDPEHPSRSWSSSFRGGWDAPDDRTSSRDESFRIADLDAAMIAPIIAGAPETLHVPNGEPSHMIIEADKAGMPVYSVFARNDVNQSGHMTVNHAGDVLSMYPADR